MKQTIQLNGGTMAVIQARKRIVPLQRPTPVSAAEPDLSVPERGTTGPVSIGEAMQPLQRLIAHPDRGRLLAKFCELHNLLQ